MKKSLLKINIAVIALTFVFSSACTAEEKTDDTNTIKNSETLTPEQQEFEKAIELMRAQGMSDADIEQFRATMGPMMEAEAAGREQKKQQQAQKKADRETRQENEKDHLKSLVTAQAGTLKIGLKDSVYPLSIRSCLTTSTKDGNLMKVAWVEAEGTFRGAEAIATLSKSHPAGASGQSFEHLEIWLTSVRSGEKVLSNAEIVNKRAEEFLAWETPRQQAIMERYQVTDDMSVKELTATMDAQQKALDELAAESEEHKLQYALAHGPVNIDGKTVSILSSNISWSGSRRTPDAFFDLDDTQLYAVAACE